MTPRRNTNIQLIEVLFSCKSLFSVIKAVFRYIIVRYAQGYFNVINPGGITKPLNIFLGEPQFRPFVSIITVHDTRWISPG